VRVGLVLALRAEARAVLGRVRWEASGGGTSKGGPTVARTSLGVSELIAVLSGVGMERATVATALALDEGAELLLSLGVSGALSPGLGSGDVVLAGGVILEGGGGFHAARKDLLDLAAGALKRAGVVFTRGPLVSTTGAVLTAGAKARLFRESGALAVDMESGAVAALAAREGVPFLVMRAVCDTAEQGISEDLYDCLDDEGGLMTGRLLGRCLKRPSLLKEMVHLKKSFDSATSSLGRAWRALVDEGFFSALVPGSGAQGQ